MCMRYLCFVWQQGPTKIRNLIAEIWRDVSRGNLAIEHQSPHSEIHPERDWISVFSCFVARNYRLTESHYIARKSNRIYFELIDGKEASWKEIWNAFGDFVERNHRGFEIPQYQWAHRKISQIFQVGLKRVGKDLCPLCATVNAEILRREGDAKKEMQEILHRHTAEAFATSDCISYIARKSVNSFLYRDIAMLAGANPMQHYGTTMHIQADWDRDRSEFDGKVQSQYYKSKVFIHQLNCVVHGMQKSRLIYAWSEMVGGKKAEELVTCLMQILRFRNPGAQHVIISHDAAMISEKLLQFMAWSCHPKNPHRICESFKCYGWVTGHNRNECDSLGAQAQCYYAFRELFRTCGDRAKYLNDCCADTHLTMEQMCEFYCILEAFQRIFKKHSKWRDQYGERVLMSWDKRLSFEFGSSEVQCPLTGIWYIIQHPQEVWIRISTSCPLFRNVKIFAVQEMADGMWDGVQWILQKPKPVKGTKVEETRELITDFYGGADIHSLLNYYNPKIAGGLRRYPVQQSSARVQHTREWHIVQQRRRFALERMLFERKKQQLPSFPNRSYRRRARTANTAMLQCQAGDLDLDVNAVLRVLKPWCIKHKITGCSGMRKKAIQILIRKHLLEHHDIFCSLSETDEEESAAGAGAASAAAAVDGGSSSANNNDDDDAKQEIDANYN